MDHLQPFTCGKSLSVYHPCLSSCGSLPLVHLYIIHARPPMDHSHSFTCISSMLVHLWITPTRSPVYHPCLSTYGSLPLVHLYIIHARPPMDHSHSFTCISSMLVHLWITYTPARLWNIYISSFINHLKSYTRLGHLQTYSMYHRMKACEEREWGKTERRWRKFCLVTRYKVSWRYVNEGTAHVTHHYARFKKTCSIKEHEIEPLEIREISFSYPMEKIISNVTVRNIVYFCVGSEPDKNGPVDNILSNFTLNVFTSLVCVYVCVL